MKIAVDVLSIRPDGSAGGATGFALELIKGFAARRDIQVMVLCGEWNVKYLKDCLPKNVQFCQVAGEYRTTGIRMLDRLINRFRCKVQAQGVLADNGADILFCPFSAATYREKGIPTVSTILDIQHEYYPQFFAPQELEHRRSFYRNIVKKVEKVVCISDYTRETFCEKYGFPAERAQTIYIAIQNRFSKEDDSILDKLNLRDQKYIVYPANFWEHKNHKLLLNAFAMYVHEKKDLKLVLTGNPLEQSEYYDGLLKAMKIAEQTVITGYVSNEELYSILKHSKGLIYPSLFEGFGIPVVEAMHLHKLIACSNLTSLPEIGCDAICYFDPKKPDEILKGIRFLSEQEVTDATIRAYDEKLQDYATEKMVDAYLTVFGETVNDKDLLVFEEDLLGIYQDGWTGSEVVLQLKDKQGGKVRMQLALPEFVGMGEKLTIDNNGTVREVQMRPGEVLDLEEEIRDRHCTLTIRIGKTWSPREVLKSEDTRQLGVMMNGIVLDCNGDTVDLKNMM